MPGIKPERADLILAGAVVVQSVMEAGGFDCMEVTEAGLREGVFFASLLDGADPPLIETCASTRCATSPPSTTPDIAHTEHVAGARAVDVGRARQRRPGRARAAVGGGDAARHRRRDRLRRPPQALALPDPQRRAAGLLPARDRADRPDGALSPQGLADARPVLRARPQGRRRAADALLGRAAAGRAARALARPGGRSRRGQGGQRARGAAPGGARGRPIARWAAQKEQDVFKQAFGRELEVSEGRSSRKARRSPARAR